jgi:hypothetical protein
MFDLLRSSSKTRAQDKMEGRPSQEALLNIAKDG